MKIYDYKGTQVTVKVVTYCTPNQIHLHDAYTGEPFLVGTSNIPALENLEGYVAIKTYSENEGMLQFLLSNDIVNTPVTYVRENYGVFPICKLKTL